MLVIIIKMGERERDGMEYISDDAKPLESEGSEVEEVDESKGDNEVLDDLNVEVGVKVVENEEDHPDDVEDGDAVYDIAGDGWFVEPEESEVGSSEFL
jgi:hypothetical protein